MKNHYEIDIYFEMVICELEHYWTNQDIEKQTFVINPQGSHENNLPTVLCREFMDQIANDEQYINRVFASCRLALP